MLMDNDLLFIYQGNCRWSLSYSGVGQGKLYLHNKPEPRKPFDSIKFENQLVFPISMAHPVKFIIVLIPVTPRHD